MSATEARSRLLYFRRPAIFYGWYIVGVAIVAQFIQVGTQSYATGVFLGPMVSELGWSRQSFSAVQTVSVAVSGAVGLFLGGVMDRRGPRPLMLVGAAIAGISLMATALVHNLWEFYLIRGVAQTIGMALFGSLVVNVTVSKWFVARRGTAVSLAGIGISLGGVLMLPLVVWWIGDYGWRAAWVLSGILLWACIIPAAFVMRRTPEDHGLMPDGMSAERAAAYTAATKRHSSASEVHWTRHDAIRTRAFWLIILGYGSAMMALSALMLHTVPMLTDRGFGRGTATALFSIFAWAALVAKFIWGPLIDRYHPRYLSVIGFSLGAVAIAGFMAAVHAGSPWLIAVTYSAYGLAVGGTQATQESVWASYFGRTNLGAIRAVAMPFSIVSSAGGPLLGGALYDRTGDYTAAMALFVAFTALGSLFLLLARQPSGPVRVEPAADLPAGVEPSGLAP